VSGALDRFVERARTLGLEPAVRRFPTGTRTADDAAEAIGCEVAQIVKSLVFMADDEAVLALTSGANRVDTARLADLCASSHVRRASPDEARAATGFAVGGTPPIAMSPAMRTFVDETLLAYDVVWAAAGTPDTVWPVSPADLVRGTGGSVAAFGSSS